MSVRILVSTLAFAAISFTALAQDVPVTSPTTETAAPQEAVPTPAPAPTVAPDAEKERKICKLTAATGTRFAKGRVCLTRAQWEARGEASRAFISGAQGTGMACTSEQGCKR